MDPLDAATERALSIADRTMPLGRGLRPRELTRAELHALAAHMAGTDMRTVHALRALKLDIRSLLIEDLDRLSDLIARCPRCDNWAHRDELVDNICPPCQRGWDE